MDRKRVYVCGHSNGAVMAYMLAARYPEKLAGLGIVAGTMGVEDGKGKRWVIPEPKGAVPLIVFHGKEDLNLPYERVVAASQSAEGAGGVTQTLGVKESVGMWVKANGCEGEAVVIKEEEVIRETYGPGKGKEGARVELVTVVHGNHMWPGAKAMEGKSQKPSKAVDATGEMWRFWGQAKE